jgi:hypothetical protein
MSAVNTWGAVNTWSSDAPVIVSSTLGLISYTSNNVTVFLQDGQDIGVVKASFKPNSITVNYRG